jgi:hypothetical protein
MANMFAWLTAITAAGLRLECNGDMAVIRHLARS